VGESTVVSDKRGTLGEPDRKYLIKQGEISNNEVAILFDPVKISEK
jgi:hypothetical protein